MTPGARPSSGLARWTTSRTTRPGTTCSHRAVGASGVHLDQGDRTHLDLWVDRAASDVETEVERLVALGATRVEWVYPEDADFVVLADTEGNLFCIIA